MRLCPGERCTAEARPWGRHRASRPSASSRRPSAPSSTAADPRTWNGALATAWSPLVAWMEYVPSARSGGRLITIRKPPSISAMTLPAGMSVGAPAITSATSVSSSKPTPRISSVEPGLSISGLISSRGSSPCAKAGLTEQKRKKNTGRHARSLEFICLICNGLVCLGRGRLYTCPYARVRRYHHRTGSSSACRAGDSTLDGWADRCRLRCDVIASTWSMMSSVVMRLVSKTG